MADFVVRGRVRDLDGNPVTGVKVFAMDSDLGFFEDHNDDLLGAAWVRQDGTFEISFSSDVFSESAIEGKVDIYFIARNAKGEIVGRTEPLRGLDPNASDAPFEIKISSLQKQNASADDPYLRNMDRTLAAFASIGDVATVNNSDFARVYSLLNRSINSWIVYTGELAWRQVRYDGPQVPLRPRDSQHNHKLAWEASK